MEQRIEILEIQNKEYKDREDSLKKMNNSIMTALSDLDQQNSQTQVPHSRIQQLSLPLD